MNAENPVEYMRAITERYQSLGYTPYRWYKAGALPAWTPLAKPLSECRVGVLSTAGARATGMRATGGGVAGGALSVAEVSPELGAAPANGFSVVSRCTVSCCSKVTG